MFEHPAHRKLTTLIAVVLCLPLLLILWYSVQMVTGSAEFKGIDLVRVVLPDGTEYRFDKKADISLYTDALENASVLANPVRQLDGETPAQLYLDQAVYRFYPSESLTGCMVQSENGRLSLLSDEDAAGLLTRAEMEYVYASKRLPSLAVVSGGERYDVKPKTFDWQYRKADGSYYKDLSTVSSAEEPTCNLYSQQQNDLSFSVQPSHYSLTVYTLDNGQEGAELSVTSLAGLQFEQDTLLRVKISAKWSQASNAEQYGEAEYSFLALYDVPATVELVGAENGALTVENGGYLLLRARFTNRQEQLSVSADFQTTNLKFYYDEQTKCSYAALPIGRELAEGTYTLQTTAGTTKQSFTVTVKQRKEGKFLSYQVDDGKYADWFTPEKMEQLQKSLLELQNGSDGTPYLNSDLKFGSPSSGDVTQTYGATVSFGNAAAGEPKLYTLEGTVYQADSGVAEAIQSGVCVFAGEMGAGGQTVVIDHGCGIFSYYFHLGEIRVAVGDRVSRSGQLGTVGANPSGFTDGKPRLQVSVCIGGVFVAIDSIG